ncbi:MAG: hypothetical protein K0S44_1129 [Bacteroidetes bacterium]|jgi:gliding motility-associated-like protein|nr:hypothetical protein [Bacteroidota bacterium]
MYLIVKFDFATNKNIKMDFKKDNITKVFTVVRNLFILIFFLLSTFATAQNWQWISSAGGSGSDKALDIDMDKYGNQYVCGYYNSTSANDVSFGTVPAVSDFGKEGFLAKIDSAGIWQWVKSAPGGWDERVLGLCVDNVNDFVYVTGTAWYNTDFGSCTGTIFPSGGDNIFIGKFDLSGNCQWLIGAGCAYDDHGYDLVTDKLGNIYLTGFIGDTYASGGASAAFGAINVPIPFGDSLGFVSKISPAGVFQWVRTFQATDGERDNRIAIDTTGNVYVTGGFRGTKPFGSVNATSYGGMDIFVLKYDSSGNQIWLRTTGSTLDDRGNSIIVDQHQDVYVTGEFRDRVGFGTDSLNNNGGPGGRDIFVAKMDQSGNWKWAKKAGSNGGSDRGNRIVSNKQDMLFVTGQFKGDARFGSTDTLYNSSDSVQIFVAAIDTSGKWQWAIQAGSTVEDRGTGIIADDSCNVFTTGYFEQTAAFGSINLNALGRKDIYVGKIPNACFPPPVPPAAQPIVAECTPSLPNIFTPNRDNVNESFFVNGNCIDNFSLSIYNRWGEVIYRFDGSTDSWDGTMANGADASDGVYYYAGEAKLANGDTLPMKGFITLLR